MPRASSGDRAARVAGELRTLVGRLSTLADMLAEPDESAGGHTLGPADELTPEDQARVDSALARFRQRRKQAGRAQRAVAAERPPMDTGRQPRRQGGTS